MSWLTQNLTIILLVLAAVIMLALLALVISAARRGSGGAASAKALRLLGAAAVRRSFRSAVKLIERNLATRAERYSLSWTMLLNESGGAPLPLHASGLQSALSEDAGPRAAAQGLDWQFFDQGVVIQLRSLYLGGAEGDGGNRVWDDLIGLCRQYRPQRPLDCIVLTIPASLLLDASPAGQLQLVARATSLHRRLWLAQNRLALRFPVHVVVSECEAIPGFASFAAALPDATQRSILGWASPYELAAPYRSVWIDSAMDQVAGAVADSCAELCALESGDADSSAYFLLPSEVERLRGGLTLFCEELMRPSAYHESFLLRGVYLTGDCSDAAVLRATAPARQEEGALAESADQATPAFLRDIFERKIFAEVGLVRTSAQRLRRPAANRIGQALLLLAPLVWALGLGAATLDLNRLGQQLVALMKIDDGGNSGGASREAAAAVLDQFAALHGARFHSVFMPGSWPPFDQLQERIDERLQKRFAAAAVKALHDAAVASLADLTGAVRLPGKGGVRLADPANCTLPPATAMAAATALNLVALPEYGALSAYLDKLDPLALAIVSIDRLESKPALPDAAVAAASGDDLARAVKLLFGRRLADLPGRSAALERTARLYREAALSAAGLRTPMPPMEPLRQAARCALQQLSANLSQRLFEQNPLLKSEQDIGAGIASLQAVSQSDAGLEGQLQLWGTLRRALETQRKLTAAGQGEWMSQRQMRLGPAYAELLTRVEANPLLGQAVAREFGRRADYDFERFAQSWSTVLQAASQADGAPVLAWSADTKAWTATPERMALRDAVTALMIQPYVKASAPLPLPVVPQGAAVVWDQGQLDRVASLIESRKAFRSGPQITLPATLQQPAGAMVDLALRDAAQAALAQGMRVVDAELPNKASDADRSRVLELRAWLESLGARGQLAQLDAALMTDATTRLHRLDQLYGAAQLYVPRDAAFDNWTGKAGPLADALGGGDAAGLLAYVEQQKEFIDTTSRQADGVLRLLASGAAADTPLVRRWQRQAADLQLYARKSPLSSRIALETFMLDESASIDGANCADKLTARQARAGADVFAEQLQRIKSALLARCRVLAATDVEGRWQRFAVAYNSDLGRRAPFVGAGGAADALPADRDAVGAALRSYDLAHAASTHAARDRGQSGARAEVKSADQDFARVRDLLAPLFPADDSQPAALELSIEFRVNKPAELRANTIIEWSVTVGAATLRQGEPARALRWEPGMPVLLTMRLASEGTVMPAVDARRPAMTVAGRTVSFRFDDPWALLSFVQSFRDIDPTGDDGRAAVLRVEFPVVAAGTAVPLGAPSMVRVFLRARVRAPGKQTTLPWPAAFPEQLPLWHPPVTKTS